MASYLTVPSWSTCNASVVPLLAYSPESISMMPLHSRLVIHLLPAHVQGVLSDMALDVALATDSPVSKHPSFSPPDTLLRIQSPPLSSVSIPFSSRTLGYGHSARLAMAPVLQHPRIGQQSCTAARGELYELYISYFGITDRLSS
jgi:hypothetical protein